MSSPRAACSLKGSRTSFPPCRKSAAPISVSRPITASCPRYGRSGLLALEVSHGKPRRHFARRFRDALPDAGAALVARRGGPAAPRLQRHQDIDPSHSARRDLHAGAGDCLCSSGNAAYGIMSARHYLTMAEAAHRIAARDLSPVDLVKSYFARIDAIDDRLHAYVLLNRDAALASAHEAEAEIAQGKWRGALHGLPIGIKDIYGTAGLRTTCHSHPLIDHVPKENAESVRRLKEAGVIVLGKLATHEFA